jgi:hypothetical protein
MKNGNKKKNVHCRGNPNTCCWHNYQVNNIWICHVRQTSCENEKLYTGVVQLEFKFK